MSHQFIDVIARPVGSLQSLDGVKLQLLAAVVADSIAVVLRHRADRQPCGLSKFGVGVLCAAGGLRLLADPDQVWAELNGPLLVEGCDKGAVVTVGLICAIPQELAHLRAAMNGVETQEVAHAQFGIGDLDGHSVVVVDAGMGKVNAAVVATLLADRFGCRAIVFSGVAGGLDPGLQIGDVVIADRTLQHDAGVVEDDRLQTYQAGHVPFINPTDRFGYPVDPDVLARVQDRLEGFTLAPLPHAAGGGDRPPRITYGTVLTGDQYLHSEVTRDRLHGQFGGRAVEMEGAAISQVCEAFGIPWLVIRALSDLAGRQSRFDFAMFVGEVAASSASIVRRLLPVV